MRFPFATTCCAVLLVPSLQAAITDNLIVHYPLNEEATATTAENAVDPGNTDGSVKTKSGGNGYFDQSLGIGGVYVAPVSEPGTASGNTDGNRIEVRNGLIADLETGSWSISFWYKDNPEFTRKENTVLMWRDNDTENVLLQISNWKNSESRGHFGSAYPQAVDGSGNTIDGNLYLFDDAWHHVVVTYDATTSTVRTVFDNQYSSSASGISAKAAGDHANTKLIIGHADDTSYPAGSDKGSGWHDDYRIYNAVLSDTDIAALYALGSGGSEPAPITGLNAIAVSHESVQLTWDAVANADSYTVTRSPDNDFADDDNTVFDNITTNSFTDMNLSADTEYFYQVDAIQD
ncbi:MAG: LamG-like jellyroll fold domain-containing protein [Planctomycetota bacterium]